jgi:hypothetical protein
MRLHPILAGAFGALAVAGCAVLQIDVDVYKGPLANEIHVQTQQVAVMAIGAKPLLKQLQGDLEAHRARASGGSGAGGSPCDAAKSVSAAEVDRLLGIVDDVETLYQDRRLSSLQLALREIDEAATAARSALARFHGGEPCEDSWWSEIEKELVDGARVGGKEAEAKLASAYATLLNDRKGTKASQNSAIEAIVAAHALVAAQPDRADLASLARLSADVDSISTNAIWAWFERRDVAEAHATVLFAASKPDARGRFVERLTGIARAHRETRQEYRRLMRGMASALIVACDAGTRISQSELAKLKELVAGAMPDLVSPDVLIEIANSSTPVAGAKLEICAFLPKLSTDGLDLPRSRDATAARDAVKRSLRDAVLANPVEAARALLAADEVVPTASFAERMQALPASSAQSGSSPIPAVDAAKEALTLQKH